MKPIGLCARAIQNSSKSGKNVLDTVRWIRKYADGRRADWESVFDDRAGPGCDVIIRSWEEFTEQKAALTA